MGLDREIQEKWNRIFSEEEKRWPAAEVVADYLHLLPGTGDALELACGLAANGFLLAQHGLRARVWDISSVAIDKINQFAEDEGVNIRAEVRDVLSDPPDANSFDVIVVAHFLNRDFMPLIRKALRPGGLVFYQTFTQQRVDDTGPSSLDFRLQENELLGFFADYIIRLYREEGLQGDTGQGFRNKAMIIAQKPNEG